MKAEISEKNLLGITFLTFKKWVKIIQTVGYNGTRTVDVMPSQQKLGVILEYKMSENSSCQKISTVKIVHLNLYF